MALSIVQPESWPLPRGYANGMVGRGRMVFVAGQIGWDTSGEFPDGLAGQFEQALTNFVTVVRAAGGRPEDVASMTVFVTDIAAYRQEHKALGERWRRVMGRHYPAMALIGISELVEPRALVEIQGFAVLEDAP